VFFNGAKAEAAYKKYVLPRLTRDCDPMRYLQLPSTSPAHAGMTFNEKFEQWKFVKDAV